jgi:predicted nucleic acid-binding protein
MSEPNVFVDTSVLFAAVLSPSGGARAVLIQGEWGLIRLWVGRRVLQEADTVLSRKAPLLRPNFARMLQEARIQVGPDPSSVDQAQADAAVSYLPDAYVLAEALAAKADYFVTHDKEHFLQNVRVASLPCHVLTPGDLLAILRSHLSGETG